MRPSRWMALGLVTLALVSTFAVSVAPVEATTCCGACLKAYNACLPTCPDDSWCPACWNAYVACANSCPWGCSL